MHGIGDAEWVPRKPDLTPTSAEVIPMPIVLHHEE